jgi:hypothetical protein
MPFRVGKTEKQPKEEAKTIPEETLEGGENAAAAESHNEVEGGDSPVAEAPAAEAQTEESGQYRPPVFRPDYLDEAAHSGSKPEASPAAPPPQGDAFFVSVTRQDTTETHRFESPAEAQTFLEGLLEEGLSQEELTVFSGHKLPFKVRHRPIVKLSATEEA